MVPVLMYHQIADDSEALDGLAVAPRMFAAHLEYLHDCGATTSQAWVAAKLLGEERPLAASDVVLTFDDGFADFYEKGLPVLRDYGFTATVYVTTGWIQDSTVVAETPRPGRMLSWSQIKELADEGIEIAAHSHSHPQLDQISTRLLEGELRRSKALLEDFLGRTVPGMAYPFGYSSKRVRAMAAAAGYDYGCVVANRMPTVPLDPFAFPRLTVKRSTSFKTFEQIAHAKRISRSFWKERTLTKGYAVVRRSRSFIRRLP
jgi:peptidoglycan/xylan/chitin deacetylase (PgdA/CDA1 family)